MGLLCAALQRAAVALAPGETKVVAFTVVRTEPGAYSVEVDGLRDEFVVEEVPAAPS